MTNMKFCPESLRARLEQLYRTSLILRLFLCFFVEVGYMKGNLYLLPIICVISFIQRFD